MTTTAQNVPAIVAAGSRWTQYGKDRVYFDAAQLVAILGGRATDRNVHLGEYRIARGSKVYFDLISGAWVVEDRSNLSAGLADALAANFAPVAAEPTPAEVEAVVVEAETITRTAAARPARTAARWITRPTYCEVCGGYITAEDAAMASVPGIHFDCN